MLSVERAGHTYSSVYSLLGSKGWGLLRLCCRSHQVSTEQQQGGCLYLNALKGADVKMCLTDRK